MLRVSIGRTKQKFPYKAKVPEHDPIVKRGFRVDHEKILCQCQSMF